MNQAVSIFNRAGVRLVSADATADLGAGMHPRISIKGGRFTLIDAGGTKYPWPTLALPVIIVGANPKKSKVYYENGWDPDSALPPTCFSDNGVGPSMNATKKMARTCAECELGAWGSDTSEQTGKPTKACNDKKKLAVIVVGDEAQLTYEMQIPPKSLRVLNTYAQLVGSHTAPGTGRKADLTDMVTNIEFDPNDTYVLKFSAGAWIDSVGPDGNLIPSNGTSPDGGAAIAARLDAIFESTVIDDLVGLNDRPWAGNALPGPAPAAQLPPQLPAGALPPYGQGIPVDGPVSGTTVSQRPPVPQLATTPYAGPVQAPVQQPVQAIPGEGPKRGGARPGAGRKPAQQVLPLQGQVMPPQAAPAQEEAIPPFLRRAAPGAPTPAAHGMASAAPAPVGLQAAVDAAFSLPTRQ